MTVKLITKTVYCIDDEDDRFYDYDCPHYSSVESAAESIARNIMHESEKFRFIDFTNEIECNYYDKVLARFTRLLTYYLNPEKKSDTLNKENEKV